MNAELFTPRAGLLGADQIAFAAHNNNDVANIKRILRLEEAEWIEDEVVARGTVLGEFGECENRAHLRFCYAYGAEIEILQYLEGPNYLDRPGAFIPGGQICHIGFHASKAEQIPEWMKDRAFPSAILQKVRTVSHTNEFLIKNGRKYDYTIYATQHLLGVNLKVIERILGENEEL